MPPSRWIVNPVASASDAIARELGISSLTAGLLANRLPNADTEALRHFLRPSLNDLHSPWLLPDMNPAADRIVNAIRNQERIVVHGDYDADGVTATAVLLRLFQALGHPAESHLPSRMEHGYGISDEFVKSAIDNKINLVITVDCGVSEQERIKALQAAGVDVIVTDHHEPGGEALPDAIAVVNPKRDDSDYPFRELVGAGVAFKLAWAVCERFIGSPRVGDELQQALLSLLPIAALGTIADVAPLVEENRILVAFGLRTMDSAWPGLQALVEVSRLRGESPTARDVAFYVAPRINAAGRMGEAQLALDLLMADTIEEGRELAEKLDSINTARQRLCDRLQIEAKEALQATHNIETDGAFIVAGEGWHEGIIGIVSGRLVDEFGRPALVIAIDPATGKARGSGRSIPGINLFAAMSRCKDRFLSFGGHEQAAGFSIEADQIDALRADLEAACRAEIRDRAIEPQLEIDAEVSLSEVSNNLVHELDMLAPFGNGNPKPRFLARQIRVAGTPRTMGSSGRHFQFNASQNGTAFRAVVFNNTDPLLQMDAGERIWDVVFSLGINTFRGRNQVELMVRDMRPAGQ